MDPLALAAVVGLVYAGKRLSDAPSATVAAPATPLMFSTRDHVPSRRLVNDGSMQQELYGHDFQGFSYPSKKEVIPFADVSREATKRPYGQPVYDLSNRQNVTNKMNNLAPVGRVMVGPGLGVRADVAATGGFQQFFRVLPNNINEERLTTLEGRNGPSDSVVKNGGTVMGAITHQAKDSKAWFREPSQNQGQGQGGTLLGPMGRADHIKTRRTTARQETGTRADILEVGPAQYGVAQGYVGLTDTSLSRCTENRVNPDRAGNGQGMNVRADPIGAVGAMTNVRAESRVHQLNAGDLARSQNYIRSEMDRFCETKANANPHVRTLDIAIRQLENNELAGAPLSTV